MQVLFGIMKSVREICGLKVCCAAELQQLGTVGAFAANGFKSCNSTPTKGKACSFKDYRLFSYLKQSCFPLSA